MSMQWSQQPYTGRRRSDQDLPPLRDIVRPSPNSFRTAAGPSNWYYDRVTGDYRPKAVSLSPPEVLLPQVYPHQQSSLVYSPWDLRHSSAELASPKGKQRAIEQHNSLSPAPPSKSPSVVSSVDTSSDDASEAEAPRAPIRIRRIGALGISVASSSDDEGSLHHVPLSSRRKHSRGEASKGDGKSITDRSRRRKLWDDDDDEASAIDEANRAPDNAWDHAARRRKRNSKKRQHPAAVADESFRSIVDELTREKQALKAKVRRLEGARLPSSIKKQRLFEVEFYDGLPANRREELTGFLTRYVQRLGAPQPPPPPVTPHDQFRAIRPPQSPAPVLQDAHAPRLLSLPKASNSSTATLAELKPPVIPDRPIIRHRMRRSERERLAGPSNSGVEPPSLTGTGSGIKLDDASPPEDEGSFRPAKRAKIDAPKSSPSSAATTLSSRLVTLDEAEIPKALELVHVVEKLFSNSLNAPLVPGGKQPDGHRQTQEGTNEAYLGHLIEDDELSGGWTYLNLVCTMAQVHRFNVTLPFTRTAIKALSTNLEISSDGTMIRWIGPKPQDGRSTSAQQATAQDDAEMTDVGQGDRNGRALSRSDSSTTGDSSSGLTFSSTSFSGTGGDASTAATSGAPLSAQTGGSVDLKSALSKSKSLHPGQHLKRPLPGVLQRSSSSRGRSSSGRNAQLRSKSMTGMVTALASTTTASTAQNVPAPTRPDLQIPLVGKVSLTNVSPVTTSSSEEKRPLCTKYVSVLSSHGLDHASMRSASGSATPLSSNTGGTSDDDARSGAIKLDAADKLVFYADATFCTDLSKDVPVVAMSDVKLPFEPLGVDAGATGRRRLAEQGDGNMLNAESVSFNDIDDLAINDDKSAPGLARTPSSSSEDLEAVLEPYRITGMNDTRSRDLFTIVVTTSHAQAPPRHSRAPKSKMSSVVSTEVMHHSPLQPPVRRPLLLTSYSSERSESHEDESSSSSDADGAKARRAARPLSPDYLLSLSLPFFSWAPRTRGGGVGPGAPIWRQQQQGRTRTGSISAGAGGSAGASVPGLPAVQQQQPSHVLREKQLSALRGGGPAASRWDNREVSPPSGSFIDEQDDDDACMSMSEVDSQARMPIDLDGSVGAVGPFE